MWSLRHSVELDVPIDGSEPGIASRNALGFWFCGLSALGYLRFFMKVSRDHGFQPDATTWIWLGGSVVLTVVGVALIVREWRRKPSSRN